MCTSNFLLVLLIVLGTCIDLKCGLKILISVHSCFFQGRNYSESQQPKNFFQKFFEQVQEDLKKNKEIKVIFFRHKSLLVILSKKNIIYIFYWILKWTYFKFTYQFTQQHSFKAIQQINFLKKT